MKASKSLIQQGGGSDTPVAGAPTHAQIWAGGDKYTNGWAPTPVSSTAPVATPATGDWLNGSATASSTKADAASYYG